MRSIPHKARNVSTPWLRLPMICRLNCGPTASLQRLGMRRSRYLTVFPPPKTLIACRRIYLSKKLVDRYGAANVSVHLHDTQAMGLANAFAALDAGVDVVEALLEGGTHLGHQLGAEGVARLGPVQGQGDNTLFPGT